MTRTLERKSIENPARIEESCFFVLSINGLLVKFMYQIVYSHNVQINFKVILL